MATTTMCLLLVVVLVAACDGVKQCGRQKRDIMFPNYNEPPSFYDQSHGHRHLSGGHHHPHHIHNWGPAAPQVDLTPNEIPSGLLSKLNDVESMEDFMLLVSNKQDVGLGNRFGESAENDDNVDRKPASKKTEFAKCMPESVTVPLHINMSETSEMYFPTCTRVNRCGGCCLTTLYSCQPTKTETLHLNVIVTGFQPGSQMMTFKRMEIVSVEQHITCKCGCKLKAKHCNQTQVYKKSECRCDCVNVDEMQKCHAENETKLWDYNSCICVCRETRECSTGYFFNPRSCSCQEIPSTKRRAANDLDKRRRRGNTERPWSYPRQVVPLLQSTNEENNSQDN